MTEEWKQIGILSENEWRAVSSFHQRPAIADFTPSSGRMFEMAIMSLLSFAEATTYADPSCFLCHLCQNSLKQVKTIWGFIVKKNKKIKKCLVVSSPDSEHTVYLYRYTAIYIQSLHNLFLIRTSVQGTRQPRTLCWILVLSAWQISICADKL